MPYCSGCGIRYEQEEHICTSCGQDLVGELKSETRETSSAKQIVPESPVMESTTATDFVDRATIGIDQESNLNNASTLNSETLYSSLPGDFGKNSFHSQIESQLGKGIVKPQTVEIGVDGFHFKYDVPPRNLIKAEPVKEKPREYRVTASEIEANTFKEAVMDKVTIEEPTIDEIEVNDSSDQLLEVADAQDAQPLTDNIVTEGITDQTPPPDTETLMEPESDRVEELERVEFIPEPELPEPEIPMESEPELIWEGYQTWCKIPLGDSYRITAQSLIINDKYGHKLLEVSLALINNVGIKQTWLSKLFGVSDLIITLNNFSPSKITLQGISQPEKVKQILENP